jgi:hypothetical protein
LIFNLCPSLNIAIAERKDELLESKFDEADSTKAIGLIKFLIHRLIHL